MTLTKTIAISAGATIGILILGSLLNIGYAIGAWKLDMGE